MTTESQKLELIQLISALDDNGVLEQLYNYLKNILEPKKVSSIESKGPDGKTNGKPTNTEQHELLDKITDRYASTNEPDLDIAQIFTNRTKPNDRKIDFN